MIRILEALDKKEGRMVIDVKDSEGQLKELIDYIKDVANAGHTFDVVVDPGNEDWEKGFEIDGDGAFSIKEVKFEKDDDKEDKEDIEKKEESVIKSNEISEALYDMQVAMEHVLDLWDEGNNREYLDNSNYPFDKSFDELLVDIACWIRTAKNIELNGVEE